MDILQNAAEHYWTLKNTEYRIVLSAGRNKPLEVLDLNFEDDDFYHILGLHHLDDIEIPKDKKKTIEKIISGEINVDYLAQSEFFDNYLLGYSIKDRIEHAQQLETYLDSNDFTVSIYKLQHVNRSLITADYLITCKRTAHDDDYYIFVRKRKENLHYGIVSCFPKGAITYWGGKRYVMLKEKTVKGVTTELFRHSGYKGI